MAKINPKNNKKVFTDEVLNVLPTNKTLKRGVKNAEKGMDPDYQELTRKNVKKQWETIDQTQRVSNVSTGISKKWADAEYANKVLKTRRQRGQYDDPVKTANFKSPIIGTCKQTGKEIIFLGAKQLKDAGFEPGNVYACLAGNRKSTGGYVWKRQQ